jgi:hypothetical protein
LPVVELNEPVLDVLNNNQPFEFAYELQPLRAPPRDEAERLVRQKARNTFLDNLEEEERLEHEKEESEFLKIVRETKDRLQDVHTDENKQRNAKAQEISSEEKEGNEEYSHDKKSTQQPSASKLPKGREKGKSVSFAADVKDEGKEETSQITTSTWGDIQQARLRASLGPKTGEGIMKLNIVEKFPSTSRGSRNTAPPDSDDEDESEGEGTDEGEQHSAEDQVLDDDEDDEVQKEMEDEIQYREIAHRYYQQRQALGSGPSAGALGGNKDLRQENAWDREVCLNIIYLTY